MSMIRRFANYTVSRFNRPELYSEYLVFQGGIPHTRTAGLIGPGELVRRNWTGTFPAQVGAYATPVSDLVGGGNVPARVAFLQSLILNPSGRNQ